MEQVTVITGEIATLGCVPKGISLAESRVRWMVNGTSLHDVNILKDKITYESDSYLKHKLIISLTEPELQGTYTCQLEEYPQVAAQISLKILPGLL